MGTALRGQVKEWFEAAVLDMGSARRAFRDGDYPDACFHSQQAAEKALKAFLRANGVIPWGHDVEGLLRRAVDFDLPLRHLLSRGGELRFLSEQYIAPRYPDYRVERGITLSDYTEERARRCLELAEEIFEGVRGWLVERGLI